MIFWKKIKSIFYDRPAKRTKFTPRFGMVSFFNWLSGEPWLKTKDTKIAAATYALRAHNGDDTCLVSLTRLTNLPDDNALKNSHSNSYLLVNGVNTLNDLYYVDYEGNKRKVPIANIDGLEGCFSENSNNKLSYGEVNKKLKTHVKGKLPTDAQLEALKDGLLGDIMKDADAYILKHETPR